ncbi:S-protein homolog 3-like [Raphanus sativus]|uniref:S-protein homolog n=1 Tax=Raphanus sativus TaxID=3726 RepID=A0A6J0MQ97_RAPSA|nr:S-protein homolog 3-like [Raphanus sativus]
MANVQRTRVHVVVIFLLIQITLLQAETIASDVHPNIFSRKSVVRITNRLGDGSTLNLHCKSPNDDLGLQILAQHKFWSFTFRPNIWGTTYFTCHFTWPQGHSTHFDIYDDIRDGVNRRTPCIYCFWDISKDGPCRFNQASNLFDICYYWNGKRKE